jgi:hypothetical protein
MNRSLSATLLFCALFLLPSHLTAQLPTPEEAPARCADWLARMRTAPFASVANLTYGDERPAEGARGAFISA